MTTTEPIRAEQIAGTLNAIRVFATAIMQAGAQGVPSGHLYAAVMDTINIQQYDACINTLKRTGLVRESGDHLLTWTGPEIKER